MVSYILWPLLIVFGILAALFSLLLWVFGPMAAMATFFVGISVLMILVVLVQKPRGGGLSGAFGGGGGVGGAGGGAQTAFGAKVGDVLTWVTVGSFVVFLGLAMSMTWHVKAIEAEREAATATQQVGGPGGVRGPVPDEDDDEADTNGDDPS